MIIRFADNRWSTNPRKGEKKKEKKEESVTCKLEQVEYRNRNSLSLSPHAHKLEWAQISLLGYFHLKSTFRMNSQHAQLIAMRPNTQKVMIRKLDLLYFNRINWISSRLSIDWSNELQPSSRNRFFCSEWLSQFGVIKLLPSLIWNIFLCHWIRNPNFGFYYAAYRFWCCLDCLCDRWWEVHPYDLCPTLNVSHHLVWSSFVC